MEAISWPILTDICDRLPYSLNYISQTVKVLALEAFLHIQEEFKSHKKWYVNRRENAAEFSMPERYFTSHATGQHAHSCSTSGGAPIMSSKHFCHSYILQIVHERLVVHCIQSSALWKLMVKNDITDMFRCGEPCWCHSFSCLFGLGS